MGCFEITVTRDRVTYVCIVKDGLEILLVWYLYCYIELPAFVWLFTASCMCCVQLWIPISFCANGRAPVSKFVEEHLLLSRYCHGKWWFIKIAFTLILSFLRLRSNKRRFLHFSYFPSVLRACPTHRLLFIAVIIFSEEYLFSPDPSCCLYQAQTHSLVPCSQITSACVLPLIYLLTYSMEQSPSWEANWFCS